MLSNHDVQPGHSQYCQPDFNYLKYVKYICILTFDTADQDSKYVEGPLRHYCQLPILYYKFYCIFITLYMLCFRAIKEMASCLTREDERTNLAEVSSWSPKEKPEILFMLYDVGGQESYKNTTHVFQVCTA